MDFGCGHKYRFVRVLKFFQRPVKGNLRQVLRVVHRSKAKEKPQEGRVVAAGSGKAGDDGKVVPLEVKKGDRILFSKYAGTEVNVEGEEHLIIREDDILGILE